MDLTTLLISHQFQLITLCMRRSLFMQHLDDPLIIPCNNSITFDWIRPLWVAIGCRSHWGPSGSHCTCCTSAMIRWPEAGRKSCVQTDIPELDSSKASDFFWVLGNSFSHSSQPPLLWRANTWPTWPLLSSRGHDPATSRSDLSASSSAFLLPSIHFTLDWIIHNSSFAYQCYANSYPNVNHFVWYANFMVVSLSVSTVASNNHLNFIIHRSVRYLIELFIKQQVHVEDSSATKFDPIELNLKFHHSVACVNRTGELGGWGEEQEEELGNSIDLWPHEICKFLRPVHRRVDRFNWTVDVLHRARGYLSIDGTNRLGYYPALVELWMLLTDGISRD